MMDLNKLSTQRLLGLLDAKRALLSRLYKEKYVLDYDVTNEEIEDLEMRVQSIKGILETREHYPRGAAGRKARQLAKQNR